jgi:hypothetical protein
MHESCILPLPVQEANQGANAGNLKKNLKHEKRKHPHRRR